MIPYFNAQLYSAGTTLENFAKQVKKAQDSMDFYNQATHGGMGALN
jgi:hypothetical protein